MINYRQWVSIFYNCEDIFWTFYVEFASWIQDQVFKILNCWALAEVYSLLCGALLVYNADYVNESDKLWAYKVVTDCAS